MRIVDTLRRNDIHPQHYRYYMTNKDVHFLVYFYMLGTHTLILSEKNIYMWYTNVKLQALTNIPNSINWWICCELSYIHVDIFLL